MADILIKKKISNLVALLLSYPIAETMNSKYLKGFNFYKKNLCRLNTSDSDCLRLRNMILIINAQNMEK